jgi:HEAT repeat protein
MHILPMLLLLAATSSEGVLDLVRDAADANLPESDRNAAFDKAVRGGQVTPLIELARSVDADPRQRWVAIRLLGKANSALAVECLDQLLKDEAPSIRTATVMALADTHRADVAERVAGLLEDPAIIVRAAAADALGSLRESRSVPYLLQALEHPSNNYRGSSLWVRRHYVEALGSIADKSANRVLVRLLDDPDEVVRAASLTALEKVNGFSWADGRSVEEQKQAWRRWWANQEKAGVR